VISLDGVTLHDLESAGLHINDLAFSPDGRQLAYWGKDDRDSRAGNLYVQATDGSADAERLTTAGTDNGPVWSPDGTTLAFSRGIDDSAREIHTLDLEDPDAEPVSLLSSINGSADTAPAWSPDGRSIAFRSHRSAADQVWVVDADGGEPRQLTTAWRAVGSPAWGYR
jgi:Tol biopolymer transport system component